MAQVMKVEVLNLQQLARSREIRRDGICRVRENRRLVFGHALYHLNGFLWKVDPGVIPYFFTGMLHITHKHALMLFLKVVPSDLGDFCLASCREESEHNDLVHRHGLGSFSSTLDKVSQQLAEFFQCRSPIALHGTRNDAHSARNRDRVSHLPIVKPVIPHWSRDGEDGGEVAGIVANRLRLARK